MAQSVEALATKLISVPSVYPEELELQKYIATFFLKKGYAIKAQHVDGERANLIVEKGKGKKTVTLYSHLDTVPAAAGWESDPHTPVVRGDRLYGLGAYDMKGGMAVNIDTFLRFDPKHIKLRLLFCVDEEYISQGGHAFARSSLMKNAGVVLSPEPAFEHGESGIVMGRIGRAVYTVHLTRPSEHFYYYTPGNDISLAAARIVTGLKSLYRDKNGRKEFVFVRSMHAKSSGMSTPEEVTLELDASILPPHTPHSVLKALQVMVRKTVGEKSGILHEVTFKKRATPFLAGYELKKDDPYLALMEKTVFRVTGKKAVSYFRSSVADENIFGAAGKSVLGVGPTGGGAHSPQEWVSVSSLNRLGRIYRSFLEQVDGTV